MDNAELYAKFYKDQPVGLDNDELYARFYKARPPDPAESDPNYYDESDLMEPADEYPNTIETGSSWGDKARLGVRGSGDRGSSS